MFRSVRSIIALILLVTAIICTIMGKARSRGISDAPKQSQHDIREISSLVCETVRFVHETVSTNAATSTTAAEQPDESEYNATVPYISERKKAEITERMNNALKCSSDMIGWIYIADSDIDYPVVKGRDNQYYLHHSPDGRKNDIGSIFLDYRCRSDLSDKQNILFGHNMENGMFGDIRSFKDKQVFDKHRYGWFFTEKCIYRIDFYALVIASAFDPIYDVPTDNSIWQEYVRENSLFYNETEFSENDRSIALSTCASDFENARAILTGKLVAAECQGNSAEGSN